MSGIQISNTVEIGENYCDFSKCGKCMHFLSEGELSCNGSDKEKDECACFSELE